MRSTCPLCHTPSKIFYRDQRNLFHDCPNCRALFRDSKQLLSESEERERYLHHQGSVEDKGYYEFVRPIIEQAKECFKKGDQGLDYGCGHTPVLSEHLKTEGFGMSVFDPLFFNDHEVFSREFNFIVCCEVMEHFYDPLKEFQKLYELLKPGGQLICKTHLFDESIEFERWYYKNDPSHVLIYREQTLEWIRKKCAFKDVKIEGRVITFTK